MSSPTWGDPLWGDSAFADPGTGASSTGGGTGGGTGGSAGSHLFWRINITASANPASDVSIAECVFYDSSNSAISTAGGSATASHLYSSFWPASNAFDGSTGTWWNSGDTPSSGSPQWLQMQFLSPVAVDHFSLTYNSGAGSNPPGDFELQYSDDGSSFLTAYSYRGGMRFTITTYTNTFYTTGVVYRLTATAVQSGTQASFSDIRFFDPGSSLITGVLGNGFSSSWDGASGNANPTSAYAGTCSNWFDSSGTPSSGSPEWVSFQFPPGTSAVGSLSFKSANWANGVADAPTAFFLSSSTDGANFSVLATFTSAPWTTTCQTQTFGTGATGGTASIAIVPTQGFDGSTYSIAVTGTDTHFVDGVTAVTISGGGATISNVVVASATSLTFTLVLASNAVIGARTVTTATGTEAPTATFTVLPLVVVGRKRGDIGWSQIREGLDGIWGFGPYGVATDGSFLAGDIPVVGPDGATLIGSGQGIAFFGAGGGAITVNGTATVQINGTAASFDSAVLVNGA